MLCYSNDLSGEEYLELRESAGWMPLATEQAQLCLENSDFIIACRDNGAIVGSARIFWDKGWVAYLADVIVKPEYQRQGIGKKFVSECLNYIGKQLKEGWRVKVVLVSAKGKESFYEQFGFRVRPNDAEGAGMNMWMTR